MSALGTGILIVALVPSLLWAGTISQTGNQNLGPSWALPALWSLGYSPVHIKRERGKGRPGDSVGKGAVYLPYLLSAILYPVAELHIRR